MARRCAAWTTFTMVLLLAATPGLPAATVAHATDPPTPGLATPPPANLPGAHPFLQGFASGRALVTMHPEAPFPDPATLALRGLEARVVRTFPAFGVMVVEGPASDLAVLADLPGVARVAPDEPLRWHLDTATLATGGRAAWDGRSTSTTPALAPGTAATVDGRGVGIAVVDTGVDATHPDLAPAVATNLRFACATPALVSGESETCYGNYAAGLVLDGEGDDGCGARFWSALPDTDLTSGHGTHVAGIAAGGGTASDGRHTGAAPGAAIHGLGIGEVVFPLYVLEAFHWVLCHHAEAQPPIRVVSNSWGAPGPFDPDDPVNRAVDALLDAGLVVVFSAGNEGGAGQEDTVNRFAKNPRPGVLNVANYDDQGTGTRAGFVDPSSSCGLASAAHPGEAWPDVAAPGTRITAPHGKPGPAIGAPLETSHAPMYVSATGTSMAAPHVAGIAAMLLQARPTLTPPQVEGLLEATAGPLNGHQAGSAHPCAGHGLADALAALHHPVVGAQGGNDVPRMSRSPHVYAPNADAQMLWPLQWTVPRGVHVALSERLLVSGDPSGFPLAPGQEGRFRVACPWSQRLLPAPLSLDEAGEPGGVTLRMDAVAALGPATLTTPGGTCHVEAQARFPQGWRAFDTFTVRVA